MLQWIHKRFHRPEDPNVNLEALITKVMRIREANGFSHPADTADRARVAIMKATTQMEAVHNIVQVVRRAGIRAVP